MTREELVKSEEFWLAKIQQDLFAMVEDYQTEKKMKRKDLATLLKVTKGYVTQLLKGDYDHKISKLVKLALSFNKVPIITYQDIDQYLIAEKQPIYKLPKQSTLSINYILSIDSNETKIDFSAFKNLKGLATASDPSLQKVIDVKEKDICFG